MSRWILAIFAFCFALASVRAADPLPLWEIDTVDAKRRPSVLWVGISPDDETLVAHLEDREFKDRPVRAERLVAWEIATRKEKFRVELAGHEGRNLGWRGNAMTKAGTVLVAAGSPKEIRLTDGKVVPAKSLARSARAVWAAPDNPKTVWLFGEGNEFDESSIAVGPMPGFQAEPDKNAAKWPTTPVRPSAGCIELDAVTVSADITWIAFAGQKRDNDPQQLYLCTIAATDSVKLTDIAAVPARHKGKIGVLQFSPDGKTLATGSADSTVFLWDVEKAGKDWKPRATLTAGWGRVSALAFTPDGRTLAVGTWDKGRANLFFIDVVADKKVASYRLEEQLMCLAFSPDGKRLVTGNSSGLIQVWNAEALRNPG